MRHQDGVEEVALAVHGILCVLHALGALYCLSTRRRGIALIHAGAAVFDGAAAISHLRDVGHRRHTFRVEAFRVAEGEGVGT